MKTVWTVLGVLIILIILVALYRRSQKDKTQTIVTPVVPTTPVKNLSENTTQREVVTERVIVQPVFIRNPYDCNRQSYRDAVLALYDDYRQKRVIYENGIATSDPNTIQYHQNMNVAYNAYYNEAKKCNYFIR